jgi:hypothetical protein
MMRKSDIEAWVLRIVDQVEAKQPHEDSRVELKAEWPSPEKAARQIAGHANAARGEDILWIVGLDESKGLVGADNTELANWLPQVRKHFDQLTPDVTDVNVPVNGKVLTALLLSTERAPFVVRNPVFGKPDAGPVELEVPWREGRKTRSATRSDLLRLLVPITRLPTVEMLGAWIHVAEPSPSSSQSYSWDITAHLYLVPGDSKTLIIPCHRCHIRIKTGDGALNIEGMSLEPRIGPSIVKFGLDSVTVACTKSEAVIHGGGALDVRAHIITSVTHGLPEPDTEVRMRVSLTPAGADKSVAVEEKLERAKGQLGHGLAATWSFHKPSAGAGGK